MRLKTFVWPSDSNYQDRHCIDFLPRISYGRIISGLANRHLLSLMIWEKASRNHRLSLRLPGLFLLRLADPKHPVVGKAAVRWNNMQMRIKLLEIAESLDCDNNTWRGSCLWETMTWCRPITNRWGEKANHDFLQFFLSASTFLFRKTTRAGRGTLPGK